MKVKCKQLGCKVCGKVSTIQVFYNKGGTIKYARARHYLGLVKGKPQFEYHKQTLQHLEKKLGLDQLSINIDLKKADLSSERILEPSAGFGPATITLPR
jgi:hypothetical protein